MSRKRPKTHKEWAFWSSLKVEGKHFDRIPFSGVDKYEGDDYCNKCEAGHGELHKLGCPNELCGHCKKSVVNCESEAYLDDDSDSSGRSQVHPD